MLSDNDYAYFDYSSSQNYFDIEDQIDLFEFRQSRKNGKHGKLKLKQISCPISAKKLKSQPALLKINCRPEKQTPKAEPKTFRYQNSLPISAKKIKYNPPSKKLTTQYLANFNNFRGHFYHANSQHIKSSLSEASGMKVVNIRPAPIDESVQQQFMKRLNTNHKYLPHLVYHGTELANIDSILRFGFLIPNEAHPTNEQAPIIESANGQAFGKGIYCSRTATYSVGYTRATSTLLVCAAIVNKKNENVKYHHGHILVSSHVSNVIPLFLLDFSYSNGSGINRPWFHPIVDSTMKKDESEKKSMIIPKRYLRKVLNSLNDHVRNNDRYQIRTFNYFN